MLQVQGLGADCRCGYPSCTFSDAVYFTGAPSASEPFSGHAEPSSLPENPLSVSASQKCRKPFPPLARDQTALSHAPQGVGEGTNNSVIQCCQQGHREKSRTHSRHLQGLTAGDVAPFTSGCLRAGESEAHPPSSDPQPPELQTSAPLLHQ